MSALEPPPEVWKPKAKSKNPLLLFADKNEKYVLTFHNNMNDGIDYYKDLFNKKSEEFQGKKAQLIHSLEHFRNELNELKLSVMGVLN